jgi:hypothetical protein
MAIDKALLDQLLAGREPQDLFAMNRPGFVGGFNFQIGWSPYEQDDEQIFS